MRPISHRNSHANRSQINSGGSKRRSKMSQVSSTQLSGREWSIYLDIKNMLSSDGSAVPTVYSQEGPNATTKSADPIFRAGGLNGASLSFNGSQGLSLGADLISGEGQVNMFSLINPSIIDAAPAGHIVCEVNKPNYYSTDGAVIGIAETFKWSGIGTAAVYQYGTTGELKPQVLSSYLDRNGNTNAEVVSIYSDGVLEAVSASGGVSVAVKTFLAGVNSETTLGSRDNLTTGFKGAISLFLVSTKVLTPLEHIRISRVAMGRGKIWMWIAFISSTQMVDGMFGQILLTDSNYLGIHKISSALTLDVIAQNTFNTEDKNSKASAIAWAESLNYTLAPVAGLNG